MYFHFRCKIQLDHHAHSTSFADDHATSGYGGGSGYGGEGDEHDAGSGYGGSGGDEHESGGYGDHYREDDDNVMLLNN